MAEKGVGTISVNISLESFSSNVKQELQNAAEQALVEVAHALLADSRAFVPVLSGALIDSGRVEVVPSLLDAINVVRVVYGNEGVPYAIRQHEEPFRHPSLGFTGRALYLARPFELNARFYQELFAISFRRFLGAA